jgi:phospholipid transport system transporter-binding protein
MALEQDNGCIALDGRLDMARCAELATPLEQAAAKADLTLDLAGVAAVDSAALALCLNTLRSARGNGHRLVIAHPPASLLSLARLYGADELLIKEGAL